MTQPYTDTDVDQFAQLLRVRVGWPISYGEAATITTALFQELAAAGRLTPAGHRYVNGDILPVPTEPMFEDRLGDTWASPVTVTGFDTEEDTDGR